MICPFNDMSWCTAGLPACKSGISGRVIAKSAKDFRRSSRLSRHSQMNRIIKIWFSCEKVARSFLDETWLLGVSTLNFLVMALAPGA